MDMVRSTGGNGFLIKGRTYPCLCKHLFAFFLVGSYTFLASMLDCNDRDNVFWGLLLNSLYL
ncbi:hypothetical protein Hanom_Chr06g00562841 [Helianthus anomalus]